MPNLRNGTKGGFEPGSLDCESGILPLSYRAPYNSCRIAGLDCSIACGECRRICANMYENITEDTEYEEDTYVVTLCRMILRSCISH